MTSSCRTNHPNGSEGLGDNNLLRITHRMPSMTLEAIEAKRIVRRHLRYWLGSRHFRLLTISGTRTTV